jgi:YHS domain-containing protein
MSEQKLSQSNLDLETNLQTSLEDSLENSLENKTEVQRTSRSRFSGDWLLAGTVVLIVGLWILTRFVLPPSIDTHSPLSAMPRKVEDDAERALYLVAAGLYSEEDIAANGGMTPSQTFVDFRAQHDFNPQPGDPICPITRTKANPECGWTINGDRYAFCCPPCIDEFVARAKEQPDQIDPPEAYRK